MLSGTHWEDTVVGLKTASLQRVAPLNTIPHSKFAILAC